MTLIDKETAYKELSEYYHHTAFIQHLCLAEALDRVPVVDAEPVRHGKWTRENNYGIWKCSECGCKVNRANPLKGNIWNYNYCPNCGAKMDGEQEKQ